MALDATGWRRVEELFAVVVERPPEERGAFLDSACGGDRELREELESLLAHDRADSFLASPAVEEAARVVASDGAAGLVGRRLGRFEVVERLGAGGMGEVYLALDPKLERPVALKLLHRDVALDPERTRGFRREALAASALNHPNILTVYEIDTVGGADLLVSELVEGVTLRERMGAGPLPLAEAVEIVLQAARGLAAAHAHGIVHRDVKPENLMIRRDGLVKVLDFGVAKSPPRVDPRAPAAPTGGDEAPPHGDSGPAADAPLHGESQDTATLPGRVVGTLSYMSPEQVRGQRVDAGTDVWSLGVVLYEMVTGASPFAGETPTDRLLAILERDPPPPRQAPPGLVRLLARALSKDRAGRHADAAELAAELERLRSELAAASVLADAPPERRRSGASRRGRLPLLAAGAVALTLLAGIAVWRGSGAAPARIDSLAVLPFVVAGGDSDLDYLGEGIADGLIRSLGSRPGLRVVARWSSFPYGRSELAASEVGRRLQVRGVLTGRVARRGDRVVVGVELVDAGNDSHLWGEQYERPVGELATVHEVLASDVRRALALDGPTGGEQAAKHVPSPEAYELYLKGRYHWNRTSPADFHASRDFFQRAIESDPDYALAWVGLSHYYSYAAGNGFLPPEEYWPRAEQTGRRALALDPRHPEVYNTLAGVALYRDRDWRRGERELERGLALGESAELLNHYSFYMGTTGRTDAALALRERARRIDPRRDAFRHAAILYFGGRVSEALEPARRATALDPDNRVARALLGDVLAALGREGEAIAVAADLHRLSDRPELAELLERTYRAAGFREARAAVARHRLEAIDARAASGSHVTSYERAREHLLAGDRAAALEWALRAFEEPNRFVLVLARDPTFAPLRDDPRIRAAIARLRLPG